MNGFTISYLYSMQFLERILAKTGVAAEVEEGVEVVAKEGADVVAEEGAEAEAKARAEIEAEARAETEAEARTEVSNIDSDESNTAVYKILPAGILASWCNSAVVNGQPIYC